MVNFIRTAKLTSLSRLFHEEKNFTCSMLRRIKEMPK